MIHRVVLDKARVAVLNRKLREGDIVVIIDDTSERMFIIGISPTLCADCPLCMRSDDAEQCSVSFRNEQDDVHNVSLPCSSNFLDGYDVLEHGSRSYPISYKQIDTIMENL